MTGQQSECVNRLFSAACGGSIETALSCLHPDVVIHEADSLPYCGTFTGHEGFLRLQEAMAALLIIEVISYVLTEQGSRVASHFQLSFTARATGRVLLMPVVELYDFTDGLISGIDVFYKDTGAVRALLE